MVLLWSEQFLQDPFCLGWNNFLFVLYFLIKFLKFVNFWPSYARYQVYRRCSGRELKYIFVGINSFTMFFLQCGESLYTCMNSWRRPKCFKTNELLHCSLHRCFVSSGKKPSHVVLYDFIWGFFLFRIIQSNRGRCSFRASARKALNSVHADDKWSDDVGYCNTFCLCKQRNSYCKLQIFSQYTWVSQHWTFLSSVWMYFKFGLRNVGSRESQPVADEINGMSGHTFCGTKTFYKTQTAASMFASQSSLLMGPVMPLIWLLQSMRSSYETFGNIFSWSEARFINLYAFAWSIKQNVNL